MARYSSGLLSPDGGSGGGSTQDVNLQDLTVEELRERVVELENQLDRLRRREIELRRARGTSAHATPSSPTRTDDEGYEVALHQRVAVLVDVQNMYYAARNHYNSKLEFSKLLARLLRGRRLTRALAYIAERPGMEQDKFVEVLRRNGYEVRKKILIERSDGSQKGDWDLGMALDAVALADKVDVVIVVTGDGDFVTLVHYLHTRGVCVEVASFPETTALELIRAAAHYHRLDEKVLLPSGQFQPHPDEGFGGRRESRRESPRDSRGGPAPRSSGDGDSADDNFAL